MKKYECIHADTCLPDYWGGHHLPHISIPIYAPMSLKEIKQCLKNEINEGAIAGNLPCDDYDLDEKTYKAFKAAINRIKPAINGKRKFFTDIKQEEESDYSVYAYFVFREEE